jgi:hypothetical protein
MAQVTEAWGFPMVLYAVTSHGEPPWDCSYS